MIGNDHIEHRAMVPREVVRTRDFVRQVCPEPCSARLCVDTCLGQCEIGPAGHGGAMHGCNHLCQVCWFDLDEGVPGSSSEEEWRPQSQRLSLREALIQEALESAGNNEVSSPPSSTEGVCSAQAAFDSMESSDGGAEAEEFRECALQERIQQARLQKNYYQDQVNALHAQIAVIANDPRVSATVCRSQAALDSTESADGGAEAEEL